MAHRVTVYTALCGHKPWATVERTFTYRWRWQAVLRAILERKVAGEPHLIRRWKRDPLDLARWSELAGV